MTLQNIPFRGGCNFLGLPSEAVEYENARAVILPVPYDATTSYRAGAREGPAAILAASRNVELYDIELDCEPLNYGVYTLPELEPDMSGPEAMVNRVAEVVKQLCADKKFPVMLGGEHSLSTGPVRALSELYGMEFSVLQLDAHADLRNSFENSQYNHASVMRRVFDLARLIQVGIRNISAEEMQFVREVHHDGIFWAHDLQCPADFWIPNILNRLKKHVYISIDLDVFDPAQMPSVGTPEPGGLFWYQVIALLDAVVTQCNVVGFDVMELAPMPGYIAPDFLAAKLVFKLLARIFAHNGWIPKSEE